MRGTALFLPKDWQPWLLSLRPKTLTAGFIPVFAATMLTFSSGTAVNWSLFFFAWLVAFFVQTGSHFINDAFDVKKRNDDAARIGPIRATQLGLLTTSQAYWSGLFCFSLALLSGIPLIQTAGLPLLVLILCSIVAAYSYSGGPYPLSHTGLSELFVLLFYGWICSGAVYYTFLQNYDLPVFLLGLQIGLICATLSVINNLRDQESDRRAGRKTVPIRYGTLFGRIELSCLTFIPFLLNFFWWPLHYHLATFLPFLTFPLAWKLNNCIWKEPPGPIYNNFFGIAALLHLLFGLLLALSFFLETIS